MLWEVDPWYGVHPGERWECQVETCLIFCKLCKDKEFVHKQDDQAVQRHIQEL